MKSGLDAHPLSEAAVTDNRFRLAADPTDPGGGLRNAELVDRHTGRSFALWFIPAGLSADAGQLDSLQARVAASIGISDSRILKTYGMHFGAVEPSVRMEISRAPRLIDAGALPAHAAKPPSTVFWLHHLAEALDKVRADRGLAHGAVSPFWVRLAPDGAPRLDGISFAAAFADAGAFRPEEAWFSSPARRRKEAPDVADDVFGVAALAFWALAGGGRLENPENGIPLGTIESLRRARGLPPTGWRPGWDEPIVAGLSVTSSLRPATPTALTAQLRALVPDAPGSAARSAPTMSQNRRAPPWRDLAQRGKDGSIAHAAGNGAGAVTDRLGHLQQVEQEVANARKVVETDLRENALQRARLQADLAAVARSASEVEVRRRKFDAADHDLTQKLRELQEKERALGERERSAAAQSHSVVAREASVVEREASAETKQRALQSLEEQLRQTNAGLEQRVHDLATAQERLGVRQQELERSEKEFSTRHAQLTLELKQLEEARGKIEHDAKNRTVELQEKERALSEREQAVATRSVSIAAREASVVERETSAETGRRALESLEQQLQQRNADLEQRVHDVTETEERLRTREQELERSEKGFLPRRAQLALELQQFDEARGKLEQEAKNLQAEQEGLRQREADVARSDAGFATREQAITTREQGVSRRETGFAATAEKLAAERADINRLVLENKSIVEEAKSAESRIEASRLEGARIEQELAALRADLATYEQAIKRREAAVNELETALQQRENASARREAMFEALGVSLQTGGRPADTEKLIGDMIARQRAVGERESSLGLEAKQLEKNKTELANAVRENARERTSMAEAQQRLARERSGIDEKAQRQAREQQAWEAEKQAQKNVLAARAAEVDAVGAKLLVREVVQNVIAETAEPAALPPPPPQPIAVRRPSRLWPVTAMGAMAVAGVLGFLLFRTSDVPDRSKTENELRKTVEDLRKNIDDASKKTSLIIATDPADAEVSIEGRAKQRSLATFDGLPPGPVVVTVNKDGYRSETRTVVIKPGETLVSPLITLSPPPLATSGTGTLLVRTNPSGAEVTLAVPGVGPQRSPALFKNLPAGAINVTVRLDKHDPGGGVVQLKPNEETQKEFILKLTPPPSVVGGLSVTTDPEDATVEIGGQAVQRTAGRPAVRQDLPRGPVKVTVKRKDFEPAELTFEVKPGEMVSPPVVVLTRTAPLVVPIAKAPPRTLLLPAEFSTEPGRSTAIRLVRIEPQEITIAPESSGVRITRGFLMGTTEVTQGQFEAVMGKNPSARFEKRTKGPDKTIKRPPRMEMRNGAQVPIPQPDEIIPGEPVIQVYRNHPVENVSWDQAMEFCRKLTEQEKGRIPAGAVFRLPTETEWWLAVKSNPGTAANISGDMLRSGAWFSENAQGEHRDVPAGGIPNRSVQDLFGNVAEWCLDAWYEKLPESGATDPLTLDDPLRKLLGSSIDKYSIREATDARGRRVVTGGSFRDSTGQMFRKPANSPAADVGFRVLLGYPAGTPKSD